MAVQVKTRITRQRRVILEALKEMESHPTADELYLVVRERLPQISLGTVYRNLQRLSGLGQIRTLNSAGGQMRFDGDTGEHYHVRCTRCGRVDDLPGKPVVHFERRPGVRTGYQILGYKIELVGICPECREQGKKKV